MIEESTALSQVSYQAHRGSVDEAPENTLAAYRFAWQFAGAIPETDVRTTADGALICLHDATLGRTTDAPSPIRARPINTLTLADVRQWDAGVRFGPQYAGQRVPTLDELLVEMTRDPARRLYLEVKDVDLAHLAAKLDEYSVRQRVIFISGYAETLRQIQQVFPNAPAMTWIGGTPEQIRTRFTQMLDAGLDNITQLQLHLHLQQTEPQIESRTVYALDDQFLAAARESLLARGVELQLRPMQLTADGMARLLRLGVRWYVTDGPRAFDAMLAQARAWASGGSEEDREGGLQRGIDLSHN